LPRMCRDCVVVKKTTTQQKPDVVKPPSPYLGSIKRSYLLLANVGCRGVREVFTVIDIGSLNSSCCYVSINQQRRFQPAKPAVKYEWSWMHRSATAGLQIAHSRRGPRGEVWGRTIESCKAHKVQPQGIDLRKIFCLRLCLSSITRIFTQTTHHATDKLGQLFSFPEPRPFGPEYSGTNYDQRKSQSRSGRCQGSTPHCPG
jgi:hypothetical protein